MTKSPFIFSVIASTMFAFSFGACGGGSAQSDDTTPKTSATKTKTPEATDTKTPEATDTKAANIEVPGYKGLRVPAGTASRPAGSPGIGSNMMIYKYPGKTAKLLRTEVLTTLEANGWGVVSETEGSFVVEKDGFKVALSIGGSQKAPPQSALIVSTPKTAK